MLSRLFSSAPAPAAPAPETTLFCQGGLSINLMNAHGGEKRACVTIEDAIKALLGVPVDSIRGLTWDEFFELPRPKTFDVLKPKLRKGLWDTVRVLIGAIENGFRHVCWDRGCTLLYGAAETWGNEISEAGSGELKKIDPETGKTVKCTFPLKDVLRLFVQFPERAEMPHPTLVHGTDLNGAVSRGLDGSPLFGVSVLAGVWGEFFRKSDGFRIVLLTGAWGMKVKEIIPGYAGEYAEKTPLEVRPFRTALFDSGFFSPILLTNAMERHYEQMKIATSFGEELGSSEPVVPGCIYTCGSATGSAFYSDGREVNFANGQVPEGAKLGDDLGAW